MPAFENWIVDRLTRDSVGVLEGNAKVWIRADALSIDTIAAVTEAARRGGVCGVVLPATSVEIPVVAAMAVAWEYQGNPKSPGACVLISRQRDAAALAHKIWVAPPGPLLDGRRANLLDVSRAASCFRGIKPRAPVKSGNPGVRLVVTDDVDLEGLEALQDAGITVRCLIIDGRSINPETILERGLSSRVQSVVILCGAQRQMPSAAKPVSVKREWSLVHRAEPHTSLLVTPTVRAGDVRPLPIADPIPGVWKPLYNLHAQVDGIGGAFAREAWSMVQTLMGIPIHPREAQVQFVYRRGYQTHPIESGVEALKALLAAAPGHQSRADMVIVLHSIEEAIARLNEKNPKRDEALRIARDGANPLFVVNGRGIAAGLEQVLRENQLHGRVVRWSDPVDWIPHEGTVAIMGPPPRGLTWITTTGVGQNVSIMLTPQEARYLKRGLASLGVNRGGRGYSALEELTRKAEAADAEEAELPERFEDVLRRLDARPRETTGTGNRMRGRMVCIALQGGVRYYCREQGTLAAVVRGGVRHVFAASLKSGDIVLLPVDDPALDLKDAAYESFENRAAHKHVVAPVRLWKSRVVEHMKASSLDAKGFAMVLKTHGITISASDVRDIFVTTDTEEKIALQAPEALVAATVRILGERGADLSTDAIVRGIRRKRGLHRAAGRVLNDLAATGFFAREEELEKALDEELGLTKKDLMALVRPFSVLSVSPPFEAAASIAGYLTEEVSDEA